MVTPSRTSAGSLPVIGLTMGDPAGVGPELCLMMLRDERVLSCCTPVIFGSAVLLRRVASASGLPPPPRSLPLDEWPGSSPSPGLVIDIPGDDVSRVVPGRTAAACGRAAYDCVEATIRETMAGRLAAMVTSPLNKEALHLAGVRFPGHTEILAQVTGTRRYCMMLASDRITTSLVTTHTALANVPGLLGQDRILEVIQLTATAIGRLRSAPARLVVCALNPHAGEHGLFGDEEARFIEPAIQAARNAGLQVEGPLPPDTAFLPERLAHTDAYVCMYHDQGLIPFKMLAFDTGVNVTLGLPIIRTSPDHGTAFDIAWAGRVSPSSMREAVCYAARLAAVVPCEKSGISPSSC